MKIIERNHNIARACAYASASGLTSQLLQHPVCLANLVQRTLDFWLTALDDSM
jgi:hypothetical protein